MSRPLYISAVGMLTPLGADLTMTAAAVTAGLTVFNDSTYRNSEKLPIKMALVPNAALPPIASHVNFYGRYQHWHKHLLRLAHQPLRQVMETYQSSAPIPLILNLPEMRDLGEEEFPDDFVAKLAAQSNCPIEMRPTRLLFQGRAGVIEALALAEKLLYERAFNEVLVGGLDSYQHPQRLARLADEGRVATESSTDSFIPGEACGFLRLSRHPEKSLFGSAHIHLPHIANEVGHIYSEAEYLGDGLATAVAETCQYSQLPPADVAHISANGERYWAKELSTAFIRNHEFLAEDVDVRHPAEYFGDLGAATGAVLIALAAQAHQPETSQLICASSDGALRGAVLFGESAPYPTDEPNENRDETDLGTSIQ